MKKEKKKMEQADSPRSNNRHPNLLAELVDRLRQDGKLAELLESAAHQITAKSPPAALAGDILYGADQIAEFLYSDKRLLAPENNTGFLRQCIDKFREINFADQNTGRIYLRIVSGRPVWADRDALEQAASNPDTRAGLLATASAVFDRAIPDPDRPKYLGDVAGADHAHTLGRWGPPAEPQRAADRIDPS